jgi:hypothetical protein
MSLSESDTKAKLIDPVLHQRGWTEDLIRREETERGIDIMPNLRIFSNCFLDGGPVNVLGGYGWKKLEPRIMTSRL